MLYSQFNSLILSGLLYVSLIGRHQGPSDHSNHCSGGSAYQTPSKAGQERISVWSELTLVIAESEGSVIDSILVLVLDLQLHKEWGQGWQSYSHNLPSLKCFGLDGRETPPPDCPQYGTHHAQPHHGAKLESADCQRESVTESVRSITWTCFQKTWVCSSNLG